MDTLSRKKVGTEEEISELKDIKNINYPSEQQRENKL